MTISGAEPTVLTDSRELDGDSQGIISIASGARVTLSGTHDGSIEVNGSLAITGALRGALEIGSLGSVTVTGDVVGRVDIKVAGTLVVEPTGRIAAPVANRGSFTNRGYRYGPVEGRTPDDQAGSDVAALPTGGAPLRYQLADRS